MPSDSTPLPADRLSLGKQAWIRRSALTFTFARGSGPGGQCVNKLETAATLHAPIADMQALDDEAVTRLRTLAGRRLTRDDEIVMRSRTHRSQLANRRACETRLAELVTEAERRPIPRKPTRPSRGSVQRRLDSKRRKSKRKQDRGWREE